MFVLLLLASGTLQEAVAQYGGPSILSRGGNAPGRRGRAPVDFAYYLGARAIYDTGLIAVRVEESGEIRGVSSVGTSLEGGLYGGHNWRRTQLGVDYRADYRRNNRFPQFNGTNQALAIQLQHRLSRRVGISLSQTGGTTNRAFGAFAAPAFGDVNRLGVPLNEIFDIRMYFLQSQAAIGWQRSARMMLQGGADVFFIKRQSQSLINAQGIRGVGAMSYRTSRRNSIEVSHQFLRFEFPRIYAYSDIHAVNGGFTHRYNPNIEFLVQSGAFHVDSTGVERVMLSPEVAAILGRPTGIATFRRRAIFPMLNVRMQYMQERGRFDMGYSISATPGNGIVLTGRRDNFNVGYSYSGLRRMSLGASAGYMRMYSVALTIPHNTGYFAGGGMSYRLTHGLNFMANADYRRFDVPGVAARSGASIGAGLAYSSSRLPISIW